jgi:hypothetical protein
VTSWVLDPYTPDGVRGQAFEDFDPAAIDAVKDLLAHSNACAESGKVPANEVVPAVRKHPGTVANTCVGGASDG